MVCPSSLFRRPSWERCRDMQFFLTGRGLHPGLAAFAALTGGALCVNLWFLCCPSSYQWRRVAWFAKVLILCFLCRRILVNVGSLWIGWCSLPIPLLGSKGEPTFTRILQHKKQRIKTLANHATRRNRKEQRQHRNYKLTQREPPVDVANASIPGCSPPSVQKN